MKKNLRFGRYLFGLIALFALCAAPSTAQVTIISAVGDAITSTDNISGDSYYILRRPSDGGSGAGKAIKSDFTLSDITSYVGTVTSADYIFKITNTDADNGYYSFQFVSTSKYLSNSGESAATSDEAVNFTISTFTGTGDNSTNCTTGDSYFAITSVSTGYGINAWSAQICFWTADGGQQAAYEIVPVTVSELSTVDVTYNVVDASGTTLATGTATQGVGTSATLPSSLQRDYCTYTYSPETIEATTTTVTATVTYSLPFETSTTIDENANWYIMKIRSTKYCSYNASSNAVTNSTSLDTIANELFAFTGDPYNGFYIYNYVLGEDSVLWSSTVSNNATINFVPKTDATSGLWKLNKGDSGSVLFKYDSSYGYVNDVNSTLGYWATSWAATDGGSMITFTAADETFMSMVSLNTTVANINNAKTALIDSYSLDTSYLTMANSVLGTSVTVPTFTAPSTDAYDTAYAAYTADKTETNAAAVQTAYNNLVTAYEAVASEYETATATYESSVEALTSELKTRYYRIQSYSTSGAYIGYNDDGDGFVTASADLTQAKYIWQFTPCEDGYKLYNCNQGKYLNAVAMGTSATTGFSDTYDNAGKYTLSGSNSAGLYIWNSGFSLNYEGTSGYEGNLNGWYGAWTIEEVTYLDVNLTTVDGASYATTYLPFPVKTITDATAYTGTLNDAGDALTLNEVTSIPANCGVVLISDEAASKATLTIGDAEEVSGNALLGTNVSIENNSYLTLGRNSEDETAIGFFTYTGDNIADNKAYLTSTSSAIRLLFGGETTGIGAITAADNSNVAAPIYDLSGRRITKPAKGSLYIQGGKKLIAQ